MKPIRKRYIAIINWEDPTNHEASWTSEKKMKLKKVAKVVSVGILLSQDENDVRIVMDTCSDGAHNVLAIIPRRCITNMRKILLPQRMDVV